MASFVLKADSLPKPLISRRRWNFARTATLVPDLERKISIKENDIAFLAGEYPRKIERSVLPEEVKLAENLPVGLPSTLLERRPDVRQAEQKLIAGKCDSRPLRIPICFPVWL